MVRVHVRVRSRVRVLGQVPVCGLRSVSHVCVCVCIAVIGLGACIISDVGYESMVHTTCGTRFSIALIVRLVI